MTRPEPLGYFEGEEGRPLSRMLVTARVVYAVVTALWGFCWIPFGVGYYGLPWGNFGFRVGIAAFALAHALSGLLLALWVERHRRRTALEVFCFVISVLSGLAMVSWMGRW